MAKQERTLSIPRLPVVGIDSFSADDATDVHCLLDDRDALFTTSGRAAILHALQAFEIGAGDRVLVPTYHCPTMVAPIVRVGAQPVFYPIDRQGDADLDFVRSAMRQGVAAILAVHFFGLPRPMRELRKLCDEHDVRLLEDCAHAFFGPRSSDPVGTVGDVAIASLPKFFPVVEGGCLVGPAAVLAKVQLKAPSLVSDIKNALDVLELGTRHGRFGALNWAPGSVVRLKEIARGRWTPSLSEPVEGIDVAADQVPWLDDARCNLRATWPTRWLIKSTGRARLVRHRQRNYALLAKLLTDGRRARPLVPTLPEDVVPYVFPLEVDDPDLVYQAVRRQGVPVFRWDQLWPGTPGDATDSGLHWSRRVFQLGCHQDISEVEISMMAATVLRALNGQSS